MTDASLEISFEIGRTAVLVRAGDGYEGALARVAGRVATARMRDSATAVVPLDDFIAGLDAGALDNWPDPDGVVWEPLLVELVNSVLDDGDRVRGQLSGDPEAAHGAVEADQLPAILGPGWKADLTAFQRRNAARLLSLRHGADFSVPGAGKTREALAVLAALREQGEIRRALVVCPKSAYESWRYESAECLTTPLNTQVMGAYPDPSADIVLVNYERLDRSLPDLCDWLAAQPAMLVLDEAHRMKRGVRGVYGAACMALGPLAKRRMILTGTPAPNGAADLASLLGFVWPGSGSRTVNDAVGDNDLAYASRILKPLFTRTTKAELGLPPVDLKIVRVPLGGLHGEIYSALAGSFSARAEASRDELERLGRTMLRLLMAATSPALLMEGVSRYDPLDYQVPHLAVPPEDPLHVLLERLPSYEVAPKHREVLAIVRDNAAMGRKTIVWSTFVRNLTTMEAVLADFKPAVVFGGTVDREEQIRRFRRDPDCAVLLSNPATLGEGISLHHECHDAVYLDRDFQAGRFLQSLDRIHRLGLPPDAETRVIVLASEGTIDEVVADRLRSKLEFMGRILDDPAVQQLADLEEATTVVGGMDAEDILALQRHLQRG
ncbi:DEAD/DEAH box helicase [Actinospica durhamensis]|uniref:DEAD/DEAH box helicase n=1 Tax=Actinospica durhamensis TaxID=1508375 RepID=A0A941EJV2_9ACTN|nr:DEAD/DEAH box helicase [Actinospica durhamensis]MBR7833825.1 DEAD/DEAH box helicase [Actinospica durhamensis]